MNEILFCLKSSLSESNCLPGLQTKERREGGREEERGSNKLGEEADTKRVVLMMFGQRIFDVVAVGGLEDWPGRGEKVPVRDISWC